MVIGSSYIRMTHLAWGAPLVVGLAVAYATSGAILQRLEDSSPRGEAAPPPSLAERPSQAPDIILQKNILGLRVPAPESAASAAAARDQAQAGVNPADWTLLGAIRGDRSAALVLQEDGGQLIFLNDSLKGWALAEVREESVVWTAGADRRETPLRRDKPAPAPGKTVAEAPAAAQAEGQSEKYTLGREEADKFLADPNAVLSQARFSPSLNGDKVDGFRVTSIKNESLFARMGMRNGDVLTAINGEQIDNPEKLLSVYSGLKSAQAVNLNVRRQGKVQSILVDIH